MEDYEIEIQNLKRDVIRDARAMLQRPIKPHTATTLQRTADLKPRDPTEAWLSEKPLDVTSREFSQWLARQPLTEQPALDDHRHGTAGDHPSVRPAALFTEQQLQVIGAALGHERKLHRAEVGKIREDMQIERKSLTKAIHDSRSIADGAVKRVRADADRRQAKSEARIEELQTLVASLELRIDALVQKQAVEAKIIDLPAFTSKRHG